MYEIGNIVVHPGVGVCKIHDIRTEQFSDLQPKLYYILKPVYENGSTVYTPVDSDKITLRRMLTESDVYELIHSVSTEQPLWVDNDAQRQTSFTEILRGGDDRKLIQLVVEIHRKILEKQSEGKKLHIADKRILMEAEKILHQEFAYSLKLKLDEVAPFIIKELGVER